MAVGRWWSATPATGRTSSASPPPAQPVVSLPDTRPDCAPATPPLLHDGRHCLRLPTSADIPAVLRFFRDNRAPLAAYEPRRPDSFYTQEFWQLRVPQLTQQLAEKRSCHLLVFLADNQTLIGEVNFSNYVAYPAHTATLGYAIDHRYWGRGHMRAALTLALPYAIQQLNLHRVCANHLPDNQRSAALLQRFGFRQEGYAKDYLLIDGVWRDHVLNALVCTDWQGREPTAALLQTPSGHAS